MLQVVQTMERILYASNDEESKRVIAEAQVKMLRRMHTDCASRCMGSEPCPRR